jgi:hypothetical protein
MEEKGREVYPFDLDAEKVGDLEDQRVLLLEVLVALGLSQEDLEQQTRNAHVFHVGLHERFTTITRM